MKHVTYIGSAVVMLAVGQPTAANWKAVEDMMLTPWGESLDPAAVWQEYPRPQMVRDSWQNLNGLWQYAVTAKDASKPDSWDGEILVPFALEAPLSGVGRTLLPEDALWYERAFPADASGLRTLLHFEAVDYQCDVWVNGQRVGSHTGGNIPFYFDITDALGTGGNTLSVRVLDATSATGTFQLRGKQRFDNKGIWYTPVSGIWQTVWLETVPSTHIEGLKISTRLDGSIRIDPSIHGDGKIRATVSFGGKKLAEGGRTLKVDHPKLWSPDEPNLYDLKVELLDADEKVVDTVHSYTGIREVGKTKDADGNWHFTLNGEPIFHWGPLDQGWWPDGLLTPPSEEAMLFDMKYLKASGFNMIRKHIKVEPRRFYYQCDKMGFLVWQDHVSGGKSPKWHRLDPEWDQTHNVPEPDDPMDADWPDAAHNQWMAELKGMIDHLYNHPSIVVWTPFNEAWGQHRTLAVGEWIVQADPSRLVNIASGGNFAPVGDIADMHSYPHPVFPFHMAVYDDYIKVIGEFGGHGWAVDGHQWKRDKKKFVYGGMPKTIEEYKERYAESIRKLGELKKRGVAAAVYTQTSDVEGEVNGLITYDRKVVKIPAEELNGLHVETMLVGN